MVLTAILSFIAGLSVGAFLTFHLLLSYDEVENFGPLGGGEYSELEGALPSRTSFYDNATVDNDANRLVGDTDEIRAIFAKRRQAGR